LETCSSKKDSNPQSLSNDSTPITICTRCVVDSTVPGARFDVNGECNYCKIHDKLEKQYPLTVEGEKRFSELLKNVRTAGRNEPFDCVLGISGGRDSIYTLYMAKQWGLKPLAVHFNDGFGNPVAGENMKRATERLKIQLITITSDWRESKDLKLSFLKASTPDLEQGTDIGIATALYGVAAKKNIKYMLIGQSFRTEGIMPLPWNYLDGKYLKSVQSQFGTVPLRKWKPDDPGFNLDLFQLFYYAIVKRIKTIPVLYYVPYVRREAEELIVKELGWVNPGAHYFDDLYQSLMNYLLRIKFNCDRRKINYSALVRSGQMPREEALKRISEIYIIEDPKVMDLCIKRLGITREQFDEFLALPPKTFRDYPSHYSLIKKLRLPIKLAAQLNLIPTTAYEKYFDCD
jgi:N-acetyl sugar amidotransferase